MLATTLLKICVLMLGSFKIFVRAGDWTRISYGVG